MKRHVVIALNLLLIGVGAASVASDEPPGKRRVPWETEQYKQAEHMEFVKKILNKGRDPFREQRRVYKPDCGRPVEPICWPNYIMAIKEGE